MKTVKIILWIQLILGLLSGFLALVECHAASDRFPRALMHQFLYSDAKRSVDYQEPPRVGKESVEKILSDFTASTKAGAAAASLWFYTSGAMAILAIVMLRLVGKITPPIPKRGENA